MFASSFGKKHHLTAGTTYDWDLDSYYGHKSRKNYLKFLEELCSEIEHQKRILCVYIKDHIRPFEF